jgi:hypothetical protein
MLKNGLRASRHKAVFQIAFRLIEESFQKKQKERFIKSLYVRTYLAAKTSISKIKGEFGGISLPAPAAP